MDGVDSVDGLVVRGKLVVIATVCVIGFVVVLFVIACNIEQSVAIVGLGVDCVVGCAFGCVVGVVVDSVVGCVIGCVVGCVNGMVVDSVVGCVVGMEVDRVVESVVKAGVDNLVVGAKVGFRVVDGEQLVPTVPTILTFIRQGVGFQCCLFPFVISCNWHANQFYNVFD